MYSVGYNDILDNMHCNHPGNVFNIEQTMLKFQYLSSSLTLRRHCYFGPRPPDKSACWKTIFFISHPKHTLWVLKRTVSLRRFFWAPKHMFKLTSKKIITILRSWNFLTGGEFNNASALGRSLYWCQALHIMNKDRYQSTSARRALALLNSPLDLW